LNDRVIELITNPFKTINPSYIFVNMDDFCKEIQLMLEEKLIEDKKLAKRNRKTSLCESEIIGLMVLFHTGKFTNLKSFYIHYSLPGRLPRYTC